MTKLKNLIGMKVSISIQDIEKDIKILVNKLWVIKLECIKLGSIIEKHNGKSNEN